MNPEITIASYDPKEGDAPLQVRAISKLTDPDRRIRTLEWLYRPIGTQSWVVAASSVPENSIQTYSFAQPATYEIKLRGVYDGGTAETGLQRLVTVRAAAPGGPDPKPKPSGTMATLRTASGRYLNGAPDGLLVVGNDPQEFEFLGLGGEKFAWRGANGKLAAAEDGGGREIRFRSEEVAGGWEIFHLARVEGGITLRAHDGGLFVCAENAGDGPVIVNKQRAGSWETFTPSRPLPPGPTVKIEGRIRVEGRAFINDGGVFRPCFVSALAILQKNDDQLNVYLDWASQTGFNGIRVFAGALMWANQTAESARARLPFLLEQCKKRELYCEVTALTDTKDGRYDKREHVRVMSDICARVEHTLFEIANEYPHVTQDDETHDVNYLMKLRRDVVASSLATAIGASENDEPDSGRVPQADWVSLHLDRGRDKWNQVRRVRELENASANYKKPVMNNEPIGADERDGGDTGRKQRIGDPAFFFAMGVLNRLFEVGGVHHSEHGLKADLPGPNQQACADAYLRGFRAVKTKTRLSFQNAGWAGSPVQGAAFDAGVVRAYSGLATDGSENLLVLVGLTGDPRLQMQNGWRLGETVDEMPGVKVVRLER
jgi:hypothetical protein